MRGVGIILGLVLALMGLLVAVNYWVGPKLVDLAIFDPARDQPYLLLDFARGPDPDVYTARYQAPLSGLVASEGGVFLGGYQLSHLMTGRGEDVWPYLNHFHMARAQDVVQVMTASPFRLLQQHIPLVESTQLGGYLDAPPRWGEAVVVWLVERHRQGGDPLQPIREVLALGPGTIAWDADIDNLSGAAGWQYLMVVEFASEQAAMSWLRHTEVATARSLVNGNSRQLAVAVYARRAA